MKRRRMILFVLGIAFGAERAAFAAEDTEPVEPVFVGYLYGQPEGLDFGLYTHLFHAFIVAEADGTIRPTKGVPDADLARRAHDAGVEIVLSLGGWGWDDEFAAIVSNPEAEDRYVATVLQLVEDHDYDGIDLDWEYPDTEEEVVGFERLCRRLRAGLDEIEERAGRPMLFTMAASANRGTLRWLDKELLLETMDWVNIMTYDMAGDWTDYAGHHAPLFPSSKHPEAAERSAASSMMYLVEQRGFPAERLALGIPLYGRGFAVEEPYASTVNAPDRPIPRGHYANLHHLLHQEDWTRHWNDETKTPWLIAPDHSVVIGYDDAESVAIKTRWAMEQGFRGVFFWQVAADRLPDGSHPLQEAARQVWEEANKAASKGAG